MKDWEINNWGEYDEAIDKDGDFDMEEVLFRRFTDKTTQVIKKIKELGLPEIGQQLRLITTRAFNSVAIIKFIAEREIIEEAKFVIFSINRHAARELIELKEAGRLKKAVMIISSMRNAGVKNKSIAVNMLKEHFKIIFIIAHAKITLLKTNKGNYYSIEGSGNYSYNARLEQYVIDNDKQLWDFSKIWMLEVEKLKKKSKQKID